MKIGVIGSRGIGDLQGGIERYCSQFYRELRPHGFDITIFVRQTTNSVESIHGVRVIPLPVPRWRSFETVLHSFLSVFVARAMGIRILHVQGIGSCLPLPIAKALGMRVVVRHIGADYYRSKWGWMAKTMLRVGEYFASCHADSVVCLTEHIADEFYRSTKRRDNVFVVPNGIDAPPPSPSDAILLRLNLTRSRYVLGVGRFVPEKNFHLLINAFLEAKLPPDTKLVLAGAIDYKSSYGRSLVELAERGKRVVMPGALFGDDLWSLYRNAGLFVLPSSHEGMSFALLEASISGAKIIASDIPANADVCKDYAELFRVESLEALRGAIQREWGRVRLPDEIERQVTACKSRHDWRTIARAMIPVFSIRRQRSAATVR